MAFGWPATFARAAGETAYVHLGQGPRVLFAYVLVEELSPQIVVLSLLGASFAYSPFSKCHNLDPKVEIAVANMMKNATSNSSGTPPIDRGVFETPFGKSWMRSLPFELWQALVFLMLTGQLKLRDDPKPEQRHSCT